MSGVPFLTEPERRSLVREDRSQLLAVCVPLLAAAAVGYDKVINDFMPDTIGFSALGATALLGITAFKSAARHKAGLLSSGRER